MPDMSRHDLKKNELEDVVVGAVTWIKNNLNLFFSIAVTVLVVFILSIFFFTRYHAIGQRAQDRLSIARGQLAQGHGDQGLALLNEILTKYPDTRASTEARLTKVEYLIIQKNYDEAEKTVLPVVESGKPATVVPLAYVTLGAIQEDSEKFKEAIQTYTRFLDRYPDHFLVPRVYESLGRVNELTASVQDAKAAYEKLATLYPATGWARHAQDRLAILSGQTPPPPAHP